MTRIRIENKNLNDIFNLPCVYALSKSGVNHDINVHLYCNDVTARSETHVAYIGDWLVEENGLWKVERRKQNG